ncbi:hypothetical protein KR51_00010150 [Rubidibacter lacunae KORDI 51-2]|uniref:Uncharacterized protein n=1 Tax=Rubidibacter lacunae KORDI 51-2 TaxID=582515 RepID=U5DKW2_9CHRO|nr:hypothetical protein [Rubidibacter lacunae]ERN42326.1 hypothetical protein KR51_00010150 [Rubidibacter lacunae KORDI 51-2]
MSVFGRHRRNDEYFDRYCERIDKTFEEVDFIKDEIKCLKQSISRARNQANVFRKALIALISLISVLTGVGIMKISDFSNHVMKFLYTPDFIIDEFTEDRNFEIDVHAIAQKDKNIHEDILALTDPWNAEHYSSFASRGEVEHGESYLLQALRRQNSEAVNAVLTDDRLALANPNFFTRSFNGVRIMVDIELLGVSGPPDKCAGSIIKPTDNAVIFVRSSKNSNKEKIIDCKGPTRPNITVVLAADTPMGGFSGPYMLVGVNEVDKPIKPTVRVTKKVAEELGFQGDFRVSGTLEINSGY